MAISANATCSVRLLDYNNYYNRIIKAEQLALFPSDPDGYSKFELAQLGYVNFELNDGVQTRLVIRWTPTVVNQLPNYLIAYVPTNREADDYDVTRWFIIEQRKLSGSMYQLELRRDLVADYWERLVDAPMYIEKGVASMLDSARFNKEGVSLNQIKTWQRKIYDKLGVPWVLLYMPKNALPEAVEITAQFEVDDTNLDGVYDSEADYPFASYLAATQNKVAVSGAAIEMRFSGPYTQWWGVNRRWLYLENGVLSGLEPKMDNSGYLQIDTDSVDIELEQIPSTYFTYQKAIANYISAEVYDELLAETGKTYKIGNEYFSPRITVVNEIAEGRIIAGQSTFTTDLLTWLNSLTGVTRAYMVNSTLPDYAVEVLYDSWISFNFELVPVNTQSVKLTIPAATERYHSPILPYDVIAFNARTVKANYFYTQDDTIYSGIQDMSGALAEALATELSVKLAESEVYDIQLVPYYPNQNAISQLPGTGIKEYYISEDLDKRLPIFSFTGELVSQAYMLSTVEGRFNVGLSYRPPAIIGSDELVPSKNIWDFKVENECNMFRLVSPNWQGQFEFSATRNGGASSVEVLFKYKPFTPFIQVRPQFSQLYGASYQDARGLICGGDFSLPRLSNAWQNYEASNKNFQTIFDRQVENLETNQRLDRINQVAGILTNTANAALTAAKTSGGAGAILGSGASLGAGIFDFAISEARRTEVIDYTKDQFAAQMDNIRAMPNSIVNVGAQTPANTIWPVLEFYTCTEAERTAFRKKLLYNGMSIGRVDTLRPLLENMRPYVENGIATGEERFYYFQGRLIELNAGDAHEVTELAHELLLGIKIRGLGL